MTGTPHMPLTLPEQQLLTTGHQHILTRPRRCQGTPSAARCTPVSPWS